MLASSARRPIDHAAGHGSVIARTKVPRGRAVRALFGATYLATMAVGAFALLSSPPAGEVWLLIIYSALVGWAQFGTG